MISTVTKRRADCENITCSSTLLSFPCMLFSSLFFPLVLSCLVSSPCLLHCLLLSLSPLLPPLLVSCSDLSFSPLLSSSPLFPCALPSSLYLDLVLRQSGVGGQQLSGVDIWVMTLLKHSLQLLYQMGG